MAEDTGTAVTTTDQASAGRVPADLAGEIATTRDGRDITQPWIGLLREARDPKLARSVDWGAYRQVLMDGEVFTTLQQRRSAVVSAEWNVLPGDEADPRSVAAGEALKDNLSAIGWDRVTGKMLYAPFFGYAVAELMYGPIASKAHGTLIGFTAIKVRNARRFRFDKEDKLRLLTSANWSGELLPDRKFWVAVAGGTDDDETYGHGLADWLYWPVLFKRNGIRFWNVFLDKFGTPTTKGTYRRGTPQADIDKLLGAMAAMATDSGIVVPEGVVVELLEAAGRGPANFEELVRYMDEVIAKVVLSQTMTTSNGSSRSQAEVHAGVKLEVVKADADLMADSFNTGPARWWTDLNFGTDVASPLVVRLVDEEADLKLQADTDKVLGDMGWERDDESFGDTYGEGYRRKPKAQPVSKPDATALPKPGEPIADREDAGDNGVPESGNVFPLKRRAASFAAFDPRPLYVHRPLKNAAELIAWAKRQGFGTTVPAEDMHVTITYSKRPVDWFDMGGSYGPANGELIVPEGGPRLIEQLGREGAIVLLFASEELGWRHDRMVEQGASWDFPQYRPHVTITYDGGGVDLAAIEPFTGQLVFGPEAFEALEDDWQSKLTEVAFGEFQATRDIVDDATAELLLDGSEPLDPIMAPIVDAIEKAGSAEELDAALLASLAQSDVDKLTEALARAGFAVRTAANSGTDV